MDALQAEFDRWAAARRAKTFKNSDQLTLGELIAKLEPLVKLHKDDVEPLCVYFDFCDFYPTQVTSWRGDYRELAIEYADRGVGQAPTVEDFCIRLKQAIGKEFTGYKGGEYLMTKNTPVWVDKYGQATETAVVGVTHDDIRVVLCTGKREY